MARRTAAESKSLILEAAQKRLASGGPEAIRLQDVAADVGLSHPAILHHFGTREGLLEALVVHAMDGLNAEIVDLLAKRGIGSSTPEIVLEQVREVLERRGHARLLAWMALSGRLDGSSARPPMLRAIAQVLHERRGEAAVEAGSEPPPYEDSEFIVLLVAAAMVGDALLGPALRESLGPGSPTAQNFHRLLVSWLS